MDFEIKVVNNIFISTKNSSNALGDIWFIHGFGGSSLSFRKLLSTNLKNHFNLFVPDFPGFGDSPFQPEKTSLESVSQVLMELIHHVSEKETIYLVTHSIGSIIGTWVARKLKRRIGGYFCIEGNLTQADAYFSGLAVQYETAQQFYHEYLERIFNMSKGSEAFQKYFASVCHAHPEAMMGWSKSSVIHSNIERSGNEFASLDCDKLYYWGKENTPTQTQEFIKSSSLPNKEFSNSGHWPMIDQPDQCCQDMIDFFKGDVI